MAGNGDYRGVYFGDFPPFLREWLENHGKSKISDEEISEYQRTGDIEQLNECLLNNLLLIAKDCYFYLERGLEKTDLFQESFMSMYEAAKRFDRTKGASFVTYSWFWRKQYMIAAIYEKGALIPLPDYLHAALSKIFKAKERLFKKGNERPTDEEIILEVDGEPEDLFKIKNALKCQVRSISSYDSTPVGQEELGEDAFVLKDIMADYSTLDEAELFTAYREEFVKCCKKFKRTVFVMKRLLGKVSFKNFFPIILLRYGLDGTFEKKALVDIGNFLGCSKQRVEQIQKKFLKQFNFLAIDSESGKEIDNFKKEVEKLKFLCDLIEVEDPWELASNFIFKNNEYPEIEQVYKETLLFSKSDD